MALVVSLKPSTLPKLESPWGRDWIDLKELMNNYKRFLTIDVKKYKMKLLKLIEEPNNGK